MLNYSASALSENLGPASESYATALLLAGLRSGNSASGLCNPRLQRSLQISSPVHHLNEITLFVRFKITKLYLICTVMQCPICTLSFKSSSMTGGVKLGVKCSTFSEIVCWGQKKHMNKLYWEPNYTQEQLSSQLKIIIKRFYCYLIPYICNCWPFLLMQLAEIWQTNPT